MYPIYLTYLYLILYNLATLTSTNVWLDTLVNKIVQEIQPKQVFIFNHKSGKILTSKSDKLIRKISERIPVLNVDFEDINRTGDERSLPMPEFEVHKVFALSLILYHKSQSKANDFHNLINTLLSYTNVDPISPRPTTIESNIKQKKHWQKHCRSVLYLHYYSHNPFYKVFSKKYFNVSTTIFPDKLMDLNGLKIKIHALNKGKRLDYTQPNSTIAQAVKFNEFAIASKIMNFSLRALVVGTLLLFQLGSQMLNYTHAEILAYLVPIALSILSIRYSMTFSVDIQLQNTELKFDTLEKMKETKFQIRVFCFMQDFSAQAFIEKYHHSDGSPLFQISDPLKSQPCLFSSYVFQKASPYAYKMQRIFEMIFESGILFSHMNGESRHMSHVLIDNAQDTLNNPDFLTLSMSTIKQKIASLSGKNSV
ncbi:hypothetical protein TSAR_003519 [Trichomalopsis sarcophagae]|uniref:Uncharacterized protein n=1 Tax=Trichomalopsis sarcophagae TaxID=543379 RepID=A0A232EMT1_9HYME|nr:hypothetical protein TSAR_003519 [Trichomalopsis sarcophagae]